MFINSLKVYINCIIIRVSLYSTINKEKCQVKGINAPVNFISEEKQI